ncbi:MAG: hypothetical protein J5I90_02505 [Caldilineales bacterium]|nr:hypothetical protein [Caldilineales bacterium]
MHRKSILPPLRMGLAGIVSLILFFIWASPAWAREPDAKPEETLADPGGAGQTFSLFLPLIGQDPIPASFTLIDQALERGEIDDETALIYEVFATFGDERLPWRFQGDDSGVIDSDAVSEATQRFAELSPAARETLVPFLIPPIYAGSWYDLRMNGKIAASSVVTGPVDYITDRCKELAQGLFVAEESEHFVVWYPPFDNGFAQRAIKISTDLEQRIYPILTDMFREPLPDAGLGCNPGDGRLDIYMPYDPIPGEDGTIAFVSIYPGQGPKATPTYMVVLQPHPSEDSVIAHELMHMIQHAYNPAGDYYNSWWSESTATWAIDYFENVDSEPDDQMEQGYAHFYLESAWRWLDDTLDRRAYGAYLWPFYLSHYTGSYHPELIAEIFAATEDAANGDLFDVIDSKIAGGWAQRWPEFALFNLNLSPHNHYEQWDAFGLRWDAWENRSTDEIKLLGVPYFPSEIIETGSMGLGYRIRNLGIAYERLAVTDQAIGLLAFDNAFVGVPEVRVQALIKRSGQGWLAPQDWTDQKWTILCQDDPAGRVEEIVLIITNSHRPPLDGLSRATGKVRMVASDLSCAGWQGTSDWQISGQSSRPDSEVNYTIRGEATPKFTLKKRTLVGNELQLEYEATAGMATWTTIIDGRNPQTGQTMSCTRTGQQALTPDTGGLLITEDLGQDYDWDDEYSISRQFYAAGLTPAPDRCPGLDTWTLIPWLQTDLRESNLLLWPGLESGRLHGNDSLSESGEGYSHITTSAWDLRVLHESS